MSFDAHCSSDGNLMQEIRQHTPCQISTGAVFSIVAVVFYFLSGVLLFCSPRPEPQSMRNVDVKSSKRCNSVDDTVIMGKPTAYNSDSSITDRSEDSEVLDKSKQIV